MSPWNAKRGSWERADTPPVEDPCPGCGQTSAWAKNDQPPPVFPRLPLVCIQTRNGWWWFCEAFQVTRIEHERMGT